MALDLRNLRERPEGQGEFKIFPVRNRSNFDDFAAMHAAAHVIDIERARRIFSSVPTEGFAEGSRRRLYVAYLGGEAVAGSMRFCGAGVAGIYSVATRPEHRRKGLGTAMTRIPLVEALRGGYGTGTLTSSPMGLSLYRRFGFREYCRIEFYEYSPEKPTDSDSPTRADSDARAA